MQNGRKPSKERLVHDELGIYPDRSGAVSSRDYDEAVRRRATAKVRFFPENL